ncbi:MAG: nucleotidyltransferase domain-containing protein, partial [Lamprocystis purpurea]|nr:nucleotidyltransferase domain-containing protein [Lamprocystis purpurea]
MSAAERAQALAVSPADACAAPATTRDLIPVYRQRLRAGRDILFQQFDRGVPVTNLVLALSQLTDGVLREVWHHHVGDSAGVALAAVGGYGRQELHPASDLDILILVEPQTEAALFDALEQLVTFLWDIGLEVGHSVRSVAECESEAQSDVTVITNLLEARLLVGDEGLFQRMRAATGPDRLWTSQAFFTAKTAEQQARWHKYGDTAYNLEPNIKENPGGLRDIQMIGWVAKRHFAAS